MQCWEFRLECLELRVSRLEFGVQVQCVGLISCPGMQQVMVCIATIFVRVGIDLNA